MASVVTFDLQRWGPMRTGLWCEHCLLPSCVEQDVLVSFRRATAGRYTVRVCVDCGRESNGRTA
jgi:hypothetical protein